MRLRLLPIAAIGIAATAVCSYGLIREIHTKSQSREFYTALSDEMASTGEPTRVSTYAENTDETDGLVIIPDPEVPLTNLRGVSEENAPKLRPDFDTLQKMIPNLVAWIKREGTEINYPVVQGTDNEYYLGHLPDGTKNKTGSIFLDFRNNPDFSDKNSLIYGHHIKSGAMFGSLEKFKEQKFYDEHPVIELYTPEKSFEAELISGYVADAVKESLQLEFADEAGFDKYISETRRRSLFKSDVGVAVSDRLVSLCTCTYDFKNARFILVGKLTETAW